MELSDAPEKIPSDRGSILHPPTSSAVCSKHVEDSNKHITEETVLQVGHSPELYKDARLEKNIEMFYSTVILHLYSL